MRPVLVIFPDRNVRCSSLREASVLIHCHEATVSSALNRGTSIFGYVYVDEVEDGKSSPEDELRGYINRVQVRQTYWQDKLAKLELSDLTGESYRKREKQCRKNLADAKRRLFLARRQLKSMRSAG